MAFTNHPSPAGFAILAGTSFVGLALAFSVSGYHVLGPLLGGTSTKVASTPTTSQKANRPQPETTDTSSGAPKAPSVPGPKSGKTGSGQRSERDGVIRKVPNFPSAVIRTRPKSKAGIQDGLKPGHRVSVVDRKGPWLQIEYENRSGKTLRGWTHEVNVTVP